MAVSFEDGFSVSGAQAALFWTEGQTEESPELDTEQPLSGLGPGRRI